jgi:tetratricopeptide (TPR) repeat protein
VFVLALGLRVAYVEQIRVVPFVGTPVGDAAAYDTWAREIAAGNWAGDETFYQAPAYPYFLALVYRFIGDGPLGIRWAQAVLGAFSCLLIGLAAARFFALTRTARAEGEGAATGASPRDKVGLAIGLTAAVLLAIYPPAIFFGGLVQKTALATFWMALLLWLASIQLDQPRGWVFLIMGIVLGLFGLTRENALVLAVVFLCWIVLGWRSAGWHARKVWAAHFVFGLLIVFYPVALRNWVVAGEWVVTTVQAGPNFYIGNHEGATGRYEPLRPGNESPPFEREDARQLAEQEAGDEGMTDLEVSRFWLAKSWDFIRHQPLAWLKLLGFKLLLAINHYEITDTEGYNVYCAYAWMLGAVARFLHFGIIGPLAAAGAVLTLSRWRRLGILYAMTLALLLAIAAFYVFARYRFPLVPLAVMFAGAGVIEFVQAARARQLGRSIAAVLAIAAVALAANLRINPEKRLDGIAYANVGAALAERGDIDAAMRFFQQAIEQSPQSPEPYYNIGVAYWLQGNTSLAMENLLQAKRLRPDLARVDFMLGAILEQEGNREDALRYYREALRVNPEDSDAAAAIKRLTSSGAL